MISEVVGDISWCSAPEVRSIGWRVIRAADEARQRSRSWATSRRSNEASGVEGRQEIVGISGALH